jgi:nitrite reductase/ring-hydroxylating ferredoxin subunit
MKLKVSRSSKCDGIRMSEDFVNVAESKDIGPSSMKAFDVGAEKICIINIEGNFYAIGNVCTHMGGPLNEGKLEGFEVESKTENLMKYYL